jgi:3-(3-hydroxy-phenyl)propionate hydroxylase
VLLHRQADNLWRIDFQLGWDANPDEEKKPERVIPRIKAMLGADTEFELEWVSIYQFACRRIDNFRHGRVLFAGDAAHQVSPFGARGANTGVQDVDNLAWKLAMVLRGKAPEALLDSYHDERAFAADDNLLNSTRATDFITPKTKVSRDFRDAVLELAQHHGFARPLVNSGRLSMPTPYVGSTLSTASDDAIAGEMRPGTNAADAPITIGGQPGWFLNCLGDGFVVMTFGNAIDKTYIAAGPLEARIIRVGCDIDDPTGLLAGRYGASPGTTYLFRPDQYVAALDRIRRSEHRRGAAARHRPHHGSPEGACGLMLNRSPNIADPDGFYAELIDSQRDLSEEQALRMNARLILLLANYIGDRGVLSEAMSYARTGSG